jgi:tetratricopeptide (TPR) repeat protein
MMPYMGIFRNKKYQGIPDNRDPDNDIEDFNALYEIKALDSLDPWDEEDDFPQKTGEGKSNIEQIDQPSKTLTDNSNQNNIRNPALTESIANKVTPENLNPSSKAIIDNPPSPVKTKNDQVRVSTKKSTIEPYIKPVMNDLSLAIIWNNKGVVLSRLDRYNEAIEAYDNALKIKPDYSSAWNNKGVVLSRLGKYNEAIEAYDQALKINTGYSEGTHIIQKHQSPILA